MEMKPIIKEIIKGQGADGFKPFASFLKAKKYGASDHLMIECTYNAGTGAFTVAYDDIPMLSALLSEYYAQVEADRKKRDVKKV